MLRFTKKVIFKIDLWCVENLSKCKRSPSDTISPVFDLQKLKKNINKKRQKENHIEGTKIGRELVKHIKLKIN